MRAYTVSKKIYVHRNLKVENGKPRLVLRQRTSVHEFGHLIELNHQLNRINSIMSYADVRTFSSRTDLQRFAHNSKAIMPQSARQSEHWVAL